MRNYIVTKFYQRAPDATRLTAISFINVRGGEPVHFAEREGKECDVCHVATTAARRKCNLSLRRGSTLESSKAEEMGMVGRSVRIDEWIDQQIKATASRAR